MASIKPKIYIEIQLEAASRAYLYETWKSVSFTKSALVLRDCRDFCVLRATVVNEGSFQEVSTVPFSKKIVLGTLSLCQALASMCHPMDLLLLHSLHLEGLTAWLTARIFNGEPIEKL